eukprot:1731597-Prymnesium_polylepis.2
MLASRTISSASSAVPPLGMTRTIGSQTVLETVLARHVTRGRPAVQLTLPNPGTHPRRLRDRSA